MSAAKKKIKDGVTAKSPAADITTVQAYLERFGYLGDVAADALGVPTFPLGDGDEQAGVAGRPSGAKKGKLDGPTKEAIKSFQDFANLPVTGELNQATVEKMNQRRCANPDSPGLTSSRPPAAGGRPTTCATPSRTSHPTCPRTTSSWPSSKPSPCGPATPRCASRG